MTDDDQHDPTTDVLPETQVEPSVPPPIDPSEDATAKDTEAPSELTEPEREKYQVADWCGQPNFGCPYCGFRVLGDHGGTDAVELHILERLEIAEDVVHKAALALL